MAARTGSALVTQHTRMVLRSSRRRSLDMKSSSRSSTGVTTRKRHQPTIGTGYADVKDDIDAIRAERDDARDDRGKPRSTLREDYNKQVDLHNQITSLEKGLLGWHEEGLSEKGRKDLQERFQEAEVTSTAFCSESGDATTVDRKALPVQERAGAREQWWMISY